MLFAVSLQAPCLSWRSCSGGLNALELVDACERYAQDGEEALVAKKAEMEERAFEEVQRFKNQCQINEEKTGEQILTELLANKKASKGAGKLCVSADPKDVAMWIREKNHHPVIWHMVKREYQFASELHAQVADKIVNPPQSSQSAV